MKFTANKLRRLAETADGWREVDLYAYVKGNELKLSTKKPDKKVNWIAVRTGCTRPRDMGCPSRVSLTTKNDKSKSVFTGKAEEDYFDSLFWTQSSIEKFMVPYYARIFSPTDMRKLRSAYTNPRVVAIGHRYPTVYEPIKPSAVALKKRAVNPEFNNIMVVVDGRRGIAVMSLADYTNR